MGNYEAGVLQVLIFSWSALSNSSLFSGEMRMKLLKILFKPLLILWELLCALFVSVLIFGIFGIAAYFAYRIYLSVGVGGLM